MLEQDDHDQQQEHTRFQQIFEARLGSRAPVPQPVLETAEGPRINVIVDDCLKQKRQPHKKSGTRKRRTKWTPQAEKLFFKLFQNLQGDLDMIYDHFSRTNTPYSKKSIKKKYNQEVKTNPDKFNIKVHKVDDKIADKIANVAYYLERNNSIPQNDLEKISSLAAVRTESYDSVDATINHLKVDMINSQLETINKRRR